MEVVSEAQHWRTEPNLWDWISCLCRAGVCRPDGVHSVSELNRSFTQQNKKRNVQQNKVTRPNTSNVVTCSVFGNLHEETNTSYMWKSDCHPVCPTDFLSPSTIVLL